MAEIRGKDKGIKTADHVPEALAEVLAGFRDVAVAFSGGVDSSYLLYAASKCADRVTAYYVRSQFQPAFELEDACRVAGYCGTEMKVISLDVLSDEEIRSNPSDRCYHCKKRIMGAIAEAAAAEGYEIIIDGGNASDDENDRPGTRALSELGVRSPLKECGIDKDHVRALAKDAGLHVWDKPAYACLATRIPTGVPITAEALKTTERAEKILYDMGFRDFRVRLRGEDALIQVTESQHDKAVSEKGLIDERLCGMYRETVIDDHTR